MVVKLPQPHYCLEGDYSIGLPSTQNDVPGNTRILYFYAHLEQKNNLLGRSTSGSRLEHIIWTWSYTLNLVTSTSMTTDTLVIFATWGVSQADHLKTEAFGACGFHFTTLIFLYQKSSESFGRKTFCTKGMATFVLSKNISKIYVDTWGQAHPSKSVHLNSY